MNQKKFLITVYIIVVLVLVGALVYFNMATIQKYSHFESVNTTDWETYTHPHYKYSLKYPPLATGKIQIQVSSENSEQLSIEKWFDSDPEYLDWREDYVLKKFGNTKFLVNLKNCVASTTKGELILHIFSFANFDKGTKCAVDPDLFLQILNTFNWQD